jgi:hypothetical protein
MIVPMSKYASFLFDRSIITIHFSRKRNWIKLLTVISTGKYQCRNGNVAGILTRTAKMPKDDKKVTKRQ